MSDFECWLLPLRDSFLEPDAKTKRKLYILYRLSVLHIGSIFN